MTEEGRRLLAAATQRPWRVLAGYWGDRSVATMRSTDRNVTVGTDESSAPWERTDANAALIVAAVNSFEALLDLAEEVSRTQPAAVETFRRNGIVFDKWPPEIIPPERWNAETLAALDPEVRWQGIAFSLYTDLCQLASHADAALPPSRDSTPDPLE